MLQSLALARALTENFRVNILSGAPLPVGVVSPERVSLSQLAPLAIANDGTLSTLDRRRPVERALEIRRQALANVFATIRPDVIVLDLFPFGARQLDGELLPLLDAARRCRPKPLVVCSVRDPDDLPFSSDNDHEVIRLLQTCFDAILVHTDPHYATLENSWLRAASINIPVYHTGFIRPIVTNHDGRAKKNKTQVLVSAGSGLGGGRLLRAAAQAHALLAQDESMRMQLVGGPLLPEDDWRTLRSMTRGNRNIVMQRYVSDIQRLMQQADVSIGHCGYNSCLDVLESTPPALLVPRSDDVKQVRRGRKLQRLGAAMVLDAASLSPEAIAHAIRELRVQLPRRPVFDTSGATRSTALIQNLLADLQRPMRELNVG